MSRNIWDTAHEQSHKRLEKLRKLSGIESGDFNFILDKLEANEAGSKAFSNFCIQLKLIFAEQLGEKHREKKANEQHHKQILETWVNERNELIDFIQQLDPQKRLWEFSEADTTRIEEVIRLGYLKRTFTGRLKHARDIEKVGPSDYYTMIYEDKYGWGGPR